jgi:hypothetical protein
MSDPVQAARAAADAIDAQALGGAMLVSNDLLNEWAKLLRSLAADVARLTRERDRLRAACEALLDRFGPGKALADDLIREETDAIRAALAPPGDGAAGGGRG